MTTSRKVVLTILIVGVLGVIAGLGTLSAFSSTTSNSGNSFAAGTVFISDNDAGAAMYSVSNKKPGDTVTQCISVTYTGSLDADVRLYTTSTINAVGQYINLTVDKGTATGATFPGCGTFTSQATIYSGTLGGFATAKSSYANGVSAYPGAATKWVTNDALVYRFTLTLQDDNNANGGAGGALSSGSHAFTWEARNQ
jgi:predicted ribosomally synthesized peptide with SipW-like signal peptide